MKYKVGDKVRVRKDLVVDRVYGNDTFVSQMQKYLGKTMTIDSISHSNIYVFKEDFGKWSWTDEMLEDVESGILMIKIYQDGNKVIAKMGNKVGIAKCSPEDEFDIFAGAKLALERLEEKCKPYGWLKDGVKYYYPCVGMNDLYDCCTYTTEQPYHKRMISRGLAFKTEQEAIAAAKKMLAVL